MKGHIHPLPKPSERSVSSYVTGFALSVTLTISAFLLVWAYRTADGMIYSRGVLIALLAFLAVMQLVVQALFFLHVSAERRVRINLYSGLFTVMVVLTIVIGSVWVMENLNYNMMPEDTLQSAEETEGIHH
jgi:cytochrome o ubiquinol oxidase operon protein cyoD